MEILPVARVSVSDAVLEQMKNMILGGEWKSGDRIAGENELARRFGVSRVSVRDAIHRLIGMGVLTARHGDGTYVNDLAGGLMQGRLMRQLLLSNPPLNEVLEFRKIVEVGSAGLAARTATTEDIAGLRALEERMRSADGDLPTFAQADLAYHNTVALLTGNSLLTKVTAAIQDVYRTAMEEAVLLRGMEAGRFNHRPITDAIEAHDSPQAERLMCEHIQAVIDLLPQREGNA